MVEIIKEVDKAIDQTHQGECGDKILQQTYAKKKKRFTGHKRKAAGFCCNQVSLQTNGFSRENGVNQTTSKKECWIMNNM